MEKRKVMRILLVAAAACTVCFLALTAVFGGLNAGKNAKKSAIRGITASDASYFYGIADSQTEITIDTASERIASVNVSDALGAAGIADTTVLATASGNGGWLFAVTEGKTAAILDQNGAVRVSGRITSIPYYVNGRADGKRILVLMRSSTSSGLAVLDAERGYKRIALDCDGIAAFADGDIMHVVKSDVQLIAYDGEGKEVNSLIIDDVPVAADYANGKLYVLCEDGVLRIVNTADYSLAGAVFIDKEATAVAYGAADGTVLVSSYNRKLYSVTPDTRVVSSVPSVYEATAVYADADGNVILRTRTGSYYRYESASIALQHRYRTAIAVFASLLGAFALATIVLVFPSFPRAGEGLRKFGKGIVKHRFPLAVLLPVVIFVAIFCYYPVVSGIAYSFMDYKPGVYARFAGLRNYAAVFRNDYFWKSFGNLLIFGATGIVKALVPPITVALLLLAVRSEKLQYFFRVTLYLPAILPGVAGLMLWTHGVYGPSGLLNSVLGALGRSPVVWLGNKNTVVWMLTLIGFPWLGSFLIFYGAFNNIPDSYIESARLEGCGYFTALFRIKIPLIVPQIKYVITMSLIGILQEFNLVYLTTAGGPGNASYVPMLEIYNQITYQNYGVASAMGVIMFLILLSLTILNLRSTLKQKEADV